MNQAIREYFENRGFTSLNDNLFGDISGFDTSVIYVAMDNVSPVRIHFSCHTNDEQRTNIIKGVKELKYKYTKVDFDQFGIWLLLNDFTLKKLISRLDTVISNFVNVLYNNNVKGNMYCPICGEELGEREVVNYNDGICFTAHKECIDNLALIDEAEQKAFDALPDNYFKGLLGALVGGLAAIGSAIIFGLIGVISALSGFIGMYVGEKCYTKFGGKPTVKMIITLVVVMVIATVLYTVGWYAFQAEMAYYENGIEIGTMEAFKEVMQYSEVRSEFTKNLLMMLFFTGLGVIPSAISLKKTLGERHKVS